MLEMIVTVIAVIYLLFMPVITYFYVKNRNAEDSEKGERL